jgi:hypothetical protein
LNEPFKPRNFSLGKDHHPSLLHETLRHYRIPRLSQQYSVSDPIVDKKIKISEGITSLLTSYIEVFPSLPSKDQYKGIEELTLNSTFQEWRRTTKELDKTILALITHIVKNTEVHRASREIIMDVR